MLTFLAWGTAALVFVSGATVLSLYWKNLSWLAHAGLIFTTLSSLALIYQLILQGNSLTDCHRDAYTCMFLRSYFLSRNVGMIFLHSAIGRKAHQSPEADMDDRESRLAALVMIGITASAARTVMSDDRRTFWEFMRALILAGFVGGMVTLLTENYGLSPSMQGAVVGISAFLADDLLIIILRMARTFREHPRLLLDLFFRFVLKFRPSEK